MADQKLYCQECGASNRGQARFCGHCGKPFPKPSEDKPGTVPHRIEEYHKTPKGSFPYPLLFTFIFLAAGVLLSLMPTVEAHWDSLGREPSSSVILYGFLAAYVPCGFFLLYLKDSPIKKISAGTFFLLYGLFMYLWTQEHSPHAPVDWIRTRYIIYPQAYLLFILVEFCMVLSGIALFILGLTAQSRPPDQKS